MAMFSITEVKSSGGRFFLVLRMQISKLHKHDGIWIYLIDSADGTGSTLYG